MFVMDRYPHLFHILKSRDVHYLTALLVVFLTIVGQIGGVPLGPEAGLAAGGAAIGKACGMLLEKILPARFVHPDAQTLLCLAGITASLAPLFPSPLLSLILVEELVFEKQRRGLELGVLSAAATASFAVHSAIRGNPYTISNDNMFDLSAFPSALYDWAIGILFGFAGALLAAIYFAFGRLIKTIRIFLSRKTQCIPFSARIIGRCVIGGLLYGTLNYIFPLNVSSGNYQLGVVALAAQSPETID